VLFLSSTSADYITGQTIVVDGGWSASLGNPEG
jgi:NAD(P)-dependent dehydrogenase (short-subunit alcohol dehydrogenase family)